MLTKAYRDVLENGWWIEELSDNVSTSDDIWQARVDDIYKKVSMSNNGTFLLPASDCLPFF